MQRSLTSLVVAAVLAVAAIIVLQFYLNSTRTPAPRQATVAVSPVVVAATDLPVGTQLQASFLKIVSWPRESVPDGAFHSVAEIFKDASKAGDRIVLHAVDQNEPLLRDKISGFGGRATLSSEVRDGMRAVSIHTDDVSGVAGFILPGDHVDIMLTRRVSGTRNDQFVTSVILQDVKVLGIDQISDQTRDKPVVGHTATVEVTLDQAQKLVLAEQVGTLSLSLRNVATVEQVPTASMDTQDLSPAAPVHTPGRKQGYSIRVIYGGGTSVDHDMR